MTGSRQGMCRGSPGYHQRASFHVVTLLAFECVSAEVAYCSMREWKECQKKRNYGDKYGDNVRHACFGVLAHIVKKVLSARRYERYRTMRRTR